MVSNDVKAAFAAEIPSPVSPVFRPIWARMMMTRMRQVEERLTRMERQRKFERDLFAKAFFDPAAKGQVHEVDSMLKGATLPHLTAEALRNIKDRAIEVEHWEFAHAVLGNLAARNVITEAEKLQMIQAKINLDPLEALKVLKEQIPVFNRPQDRVSALVLQVDALKVVSRDLSRDSHFSAQSRSIAEAGIRKAREILASPECTESTRAQLREVLRELRYLTTNRVFAWIRNVIGR